MAVSRVLFSGIFSVVLFMMDSDLNMAQFNINKEEESFLLSTSNVAAKMDVSFCLVEMFLTYNKINFEGMRNTIADV